MTNQRPGRNHRRKAYVCALFTGAAIVGLFLQAWKVHAFNVQDVLRHTPHHVTSVLVQGIHPPAQASSVSVPAQITPIAQAVDSRWSDGDVVAALSSFYQTIISYMALLIGVMGILSVITLRFFSKAAAEDMAHDAAKAAMYHFLETNKFREEVTYAVQDIGLSSQMGRLEEEFNTLRALLMKRSTMPEDTSEDIEGTIDLPPIGGSG